MRAAFHFTFEPDWRTAPLAFWGHVPGAAAGLRRSPPQPLPHQGYAVLHIVFDQYALRFSSPAQLEHCIAVLAAHPLPTTRKLSRAHASGAGPNGHWLSRLPAKLKRPRGRARLVRELRSIAARVEQTEDGLSFRVSTA